MLKFGTKGDGNVVYKCTVKLLEDTEILECEYKVKQNNCLFKKIERNVFIFQSHHKGKYLLEYVCQQLNLVEQDYLGLRYVDSSEQRVFQQ